MNTIDRPIGWTTIDEAKRLMADNVDLNSADMSFIEGPSGWTLSASPSLAVQKKLFSFRQGYELPCWSLGALLQLLPKQIRVKGVTAYLIVAEGVKQQWTITYADCDNEDLPRIAVQRDTLVEACVEMIFVLKLVKQHDLAFMSWPSCVDFLPKNQNVAFEDETRKEDGPRLYDMDTTTSLSNGVYIEALEKWVNEHLSQITSDKAMSPRGEWYHYADLYDGHIYAIGHIQGNYAGGDVVSVKISGEAAVRDYIDSELSISNDDYDKSLYEKIKDFPVATKEMLDEMDSKINELEKGGEKCYQS